MDRASTQKLLSLSRGNLGEVGFFRPKKTLKPLEVFPEALVKLAARGAAFGRESECIKEFIGSFGFKVKLLLIVIRRSSHRLFASGLCLVSGLP